MIWVLVSPVFLPYCDLLGEVGSTLELLGDDGCFGDLAQDLIPSLEDIVFKEDEWEVYHNFLHPIDCFVEDDGEFDELAWLVVIPWALNISFEVLFAEKTQNIRIMASELYY